jgi:hypothetical protein
VLHTFEILVLEHNFFEFENALVELKSYKSPCNDQIPVEPGGNILSSEIHKLISIWNKE